MDEVLSQAEIDLLLNALTSGEITAEEISKEKEADKIKHYDFKRPNKFSKEQLRTLHLIYDNFSRLVSNFLSAYLRSNIQIKLATVEQLTYEDFILSVPTPTLLTVFNQEPLPGSAVFETNSGFIFPIIDLLFGGPGLMPKKVRDLTDIEVGVLKNLYNKLLENITIVWSDIYELKPSIQALETNPQLNQIISPNETVVVITLSTNINNQAGLINICMPFMHLEPVLSKLTAKHWFASMAEGKVDVLKEIIRNNLKDANVELTALVGQTTITVRDFLNLQIGDVIALDNKVGEDMLLMVEGCPKFKTQAGIVGNKMAVQVMAYTAKGA